MAEIEKGESARQIHVHPLCITSICDHFTRVQMGGSQLKRNDPVVGLIFGVQNGLDVQIMDGTDAVYNVVDGKVVLDMEANFPDVNNPDPENKSNKMDLFVAPFESINYELLGWYAVSDQSSAVPDWCHDVHTLVRKVNEAPLLFLLNSAPDPNSKQLPLNIFESEEHTAQDTGDVTTSFTEMKFNLETTQMEKIAVDKITKQDTGSGVSVVEVQNQSFATSLDILRTKINIIIAALKNMQSQPADQIDYELLRAGSKICQQIPAVDSSKFDEFFKTELADSLMTTYLSANTKTCSIVAEVNDLYARTYVDRAREGGSRIS